MRPSFRHPVNIKHHDPDSLTFGQRAADRTATFVGSWKFLIGQTIFFTVWLTFNGIGFILHFDPYPWLLANFILSCQAAVTGPVLLISANRASARDRDLAENTFSDTELLKELLAGQDQLLRMNNVWTEAIHKHLIAAGEAPEPPPV